MDNIIMVRMNGIVNREDVREYRKELLEDIKEGLFIVDDSVKDVIVTSLDNLGIEEE